MRSIISRTARLAAMLGAAILVCGALIDSARAEDFRVDIVATFAPPHAASPFGVSFLIDTEAPDCAPRCVIQRSKSGGYYAYVSSKAISDHSVSLPGQTFTKADLVEIEDRVAMIFDQRLRHGARPRIWMKWKNRKGALEILERRFLDTTECREQKGWHTHDGVVAVHVTGFAGKPGSPQCHGQSVSALARKHGGMAQAAIALEYPSVDALQDDITMFCGS